MLQQILQFSKRSFVQNVATVASGAALSQAIVMMVSPFITRLYGPAAYGMQGVFVSMVSIMSAMAAMSYPIAIVLPKSDEEAAALGRLSVAIGVAVSLMTTIILFYAGPQILALLNAVDIVAFMYLIPISMLISVCGMVMTQWVTRKKAFALIAKVSVCQTIISSLCKACLGFIYPSAATLIATNAIAALLSPIILLWKMYKETQHDAQRPTNHKSRCVELRGWRLASSYRDFPLFRTPQVLINTASQSFPLFLLASSFGTTAAGHYAIAFSVLGVPAALIGDSVMQVFYPRFNEAVRVGSNAAVLLIKSTLWMAVLGVVPFVIVVIWGPFLFGFAFGGEWHTAGEYAQWLAVWLFAAFLNRPAVSAIPVIRAQGAFLVYEIISLSARSMALYIGYAVLGSDIMTIAAFSITGCILNCTLISYVIRACRTMSMTGGSAL